MPINLKFNGTELKKLSQPINPCAGGLGEALVPQWGVWGEPPNLGFSKFFQSTTKFPLSQYH